MYSWVTRGLFETHRLIFLTQLTFGMLQASAALQRCRASEPQSKQDVWGSVVSVWAQIEVSSGVKQPCLSWAERVAEKFGVCTFTHLLCASQITRLSHTPEQEQHEPRCCSPYTF